MGVGGSVQEMGCVGVGGSIQKREYVGTEQYVSVWGSVVSWLHRTAQLGLATQ